MRKKEKMKSKIPILPTGTFSIQVGGGMGCHLLDSLIDSHEDITVFCEWPNYRIRTLNTAASHILGISKEEAVGKEFFSLMPAHFTPISCWSEAQAPHDLLTGGFSWFLSIKHLTTWQQASK